MRDRMERGELYLADDRAARDEILRELLGRVGDGVTVLPTLSCDYGSQIAIGAGTFVNYGAVLLDAAAITVGADVWLGGGVIVCPGVTIGADTLVGAGAVVTRDLPADVVAVGDPARILRPITDDDRIPVPDVPR